MAPVSLPVTRPAGRALLIGSESCRPVPLKLLNQLGFQCAEQEDPYAAMAELARRPLVYWTLVLCLNSLYREELELIAAVKRRWPHLEIWLTHTDGRAAAMAEAMRLGADGLLCDDGLHRTAVAPSLPDVMLAPVGPRRAERVMSSISPATNGTGTNLAQCPPADPPLEAAENKPPAEMSYSDEQTGEPVLSAEELRALLDDPATETASEERI